MTRLLEGGWVLTADEAGTAGLLDLAVTGDRIDDVGPAGTLAARYAGAERIDCRDRLLLPGLVNAHLHPEMQLLKGVLEGLDLHAWEDAPRLEAALAILEAPAARPLQRAAVRAALGDALLGGTTCVSTYGISPGIEAIAAEALVDLGLRGAVTIRDRAFRPVEAGPRPHFYRLHAEEELDEAELRAAAAAHERGERIIMHCAETRVRSEIALRTFGEPIIRVLERFGLLSPRVLLSHAIHVDAADRERIARGEAQVVVSPTTEMKLADGIAPVLEYLDAGVNVAVGTDCAPCNNSNDMLRELRELGLTQQLVRGAGALPPERILRLGCAGGARALGLERGLGTLAPGAPADLVLLDARNPRLRPLIHERGFSNLAAAVIYSATGQDVTDVMIAGEWRVRARRLVGLDAGALWDELQAAAETLHARIRATGLELRPRDQERV